MKRIISLLLVVALCTIGINTTAFAEVEDKISTIYVENVNGELGETISMPIKIKDNQGIISLVTEISYDNTALKLVNVNKTSTFWETAN